MTRLQTLNAAEDAAEKTVHKIPGLHPSTFGELYREAVIATGDTGAQVHLRYNRESGDLHMRCTWTQEGTPREFTSVFTSGDIEDAQRANDAQLFRDWATAYFEVVAEFREAGDAAEAPATFADRAKAAGAKFLGFLGMRASNPSESGDAVHAEYTLEPDDQAKKERAEAAMKALPAGERTAMMAVARAETLAKKADPLAGTVHEEMREVVFNGGQWLFTGNTTQWGEIFQRGGSASMREATIEGATVRVWCRGASKLDGDGRVGYASRHAGL